MSNRLIAMAKVVQELQKERGCISLFLSNKGTNFLNELKESFINTDIAFSSLENMTSSLILNENFDAKLNITLEEISQRKKFRNEILMIRLTASEAIREYTLKYISSLQNLLVELALDDPENDPACVSAFSNFIQLKERIGRERAMGVRGIVDGKFSDEEFINGFKYLLSGQKTYKMVFLALASEKQKAVYNKYMAGDAIQKTHDLQEKILNWKAGDDLNITPMSWFSLLTEKINLLHKVELSLIETLSNKSTPREQDNGLGGKQKITSKAHTSISAEQRKFIDLLPIFEKVSKNIMDSLLNHAQIMEYKKGKILFLEGEQAHRLSIVLGGWVKVFKGTAAGDETVLQMLSSGDMIAEASIFLSSAYPVSAQVAKHAVILTLPAPIMREKIKKNNELAMSVLTGMSRHSQNLIQEYETIRLKPAGERVGWFLLKLLVDQGRIPDMVELPYDKSLIASYLDMKPETFSRSLKEFKNHGFKVGKDNVILPNAGSLCGFCDSDITRACEKHATDDCYNPDGDLFGLSKL